MDDGNRHEFVGSNWMKPFTSEGPLTREAKKPGDGSTIYFKLTHRYVLMAAAKASEMLLSSDDESSFSLSPTPIAELVGAMDSKEVVTAGGVPLQRDATPAEAAQLQGQTPPANPINPLAGPASPPTQPGTGPGVNLTVGDLAKERQEQAETKSEKAQKRIADWKTEARYNSEIRRGLHDAAKLGVMVIHGPVPTKKKSISLTKKSVPQADGTTTEVDVIEIVEKIVPTWVRKNPWSIYPDPACGEKISNGSHCIEVDRYSLAQLIELAELDGYIPSAILQVVQEKPGRHATTRDPSVKADDARFEAWIFTGLITREEYELVSEHTNHDPKDRETALKSLKGQYVPILATMINDKLIRCTLAPLHTGKVNYWNMPWTVREGSWVGIGVAEQINPAQRLATGALRALADNAGIASGVNIVIDTQVIQPVDGNMVLGRNKFWQVVASAAAPDDVRKAFYQFQPAIIQRELSAILQEARMMAEEFCSIPLISQGQSGPNTPETATGAQLQDTNAQQLLRDIATRYDDYILAPEMEANYEWLLLDPSVPNEEKGDFQISAQGSHYLANRIMQRPILAGLGQASLNPAYGLNPRKWMRHYLRANFFRPTDLLNTDAEQQKIDGQPPQEPYQVQVAKIHAQESQAELQVRYQMAMLEYANRRQISLDEVKAEIAQTGMKLRTQKELAAADRAHEATMTPPTEPPGQAPAGQAFER
jgi:hypothetical protein